MSEGLKLSLCAFDKFHLFDKSKWNLFKKIGFENSYLMYNISLNKFSKNNSKLKNIKVDIS